MSSPLPPAALETARGPAPPALTPSTATRGRHRRPGRWHRPGPRVATAAKVAVSVALLALLVVHSGPGRLAGSLHRLDAGWVTAGLAAGAAAAALQAYQLRGLLAAVGLPRRFRTVLRIDTAGRLFDAALPTNIGGDVVRLGLVGDRPGERVDAAVAVLLRRVVSMPGLVLLLALGCALSAREPYAGTAITLGLCCLGGGVLLVFAAATAGRVDWSSRSWTPRVVGKVTDTVARARTASGGASSPLLRAGTRGFAFWITAVASQTCYIRATGMQPPLGYAVLVVTCVNAVSMVPISLGGYGLREGAFGVLLSVGGLGSASQGASVGICLSAQTLLFGLIGGVVYLHIASRRRRPPSPWPAPLPAPRQP